MLLAGSLAAGGPAGCADEVQVLPADEIIAYVSMPGRFLRIWVTNGDGTARRSLTAEGETSLEPSWSPSGDRIIFTSWLDGDPNIYTMAADGSDWRQLTSDPGNDRSARYSPGGERIAFVSERTGDPEIWVMAADGSRQTNISRSPGSMDYDPEWSPDGELIIFSSNRGPPETGTPFGLWTMRPDGSDLRRLPVRNEARWPAWSPDGARIVYSGLSADGNTEIFVAGADGSGAVNLSRSAGVDEMPRWSPDGDWILFSTTRSGDSEVYAMRPNGEGLINITRRSGWDAMAAWRPR